MHSEREISRPARMPEPPRPVRNAIVRSVVAHTLGAGAGAGGHRKQRSIGSDLMKPDSASRRSLSLLTVSLGRPVGRRRRRKSGAECWAYDASEGGRYRCGRHPKWTSMPNNSARLGHSVRSFAYLIGSLHIFWHLCRPPLPIPTHA